MSKPLSPVRMLLLKAADEIEKCGWCRHHLRDPHGSLCIAGAINVASSGDPYWTDKHDPYAALALVSRSLHAEGACGVAQNAVEWNNRVARSKEDVTGALRRAATFEMEKDDVGEKLQECF